MALDEPREGDKKFEQDGYTIVVDPRVAAIAGELRIERHRWGGLYISTVNGGGW